MSELERLNSTLMKKKSGSHSSQDQSNARFWSVMKNKNQGHHLRDQRIHPKNNSTGKVQFGGLKIPESFT
jgi:hypothetical protein